MGGTSCDVCVILGGSVREAAGREVGGRPVSLPMLDIHTVGAGGGSIGWRDPGGALRAGPRSAGARPGPACYGHGGTEPTVTDANLLLGLLPRARRWAATSRSTATPPSRPCDARRQPRARAARVRRGHPPRRQRRDGPRPAGDDRRARRRPARAGAAVLRRRGRAARRRHRRGARDDRILCPRASGVLAALGLVVSDRRRDVQRASCSPARLTDEALARERASSPSGRASSSATRAPTCA